MVHPVDLHVGQRLKNRRQMLGLSQDELGAAVGVTFQQIQKYEKGLNRIGASRLYELARALNTPISYFFDAMRVEPKLENNRELNKFKEDGEEFVSENISDREALTVMRAFNSISDRELRKKLSDLLQSLSVSD